jgi:hypothetical protein
MRDVKERRAFERLCRQRAIPIYTRGGGEYEPKTQQLYDMFWAGVRYAEQDNLPDEWEAYG